MVMVITTGNMVTWADLKAGWSYGIAPGAATTAGTYQVRGGDPAQPGRMPGWLVREVIHATTAAPPRPATLPPLPQSGGGSGSAAYLATVISRGAARLAAMTDGRKRACPPSPTTPAGSSTGPALTANTSPLSSSTPEPLPGSHPASAPASSPAPSPTASTGQ
jgi:hypothetical protein